MIRLKDILSEGVLTESNEVTIKIGPETVYWGILEKTLRLIRYHAGKGKQIRFIVSPEVRAALGSTMSKSLETALHKAITDHER